MTDADGPQRWLLVGSGGAGKSTLARTMAERLGLPLIHLDREYWGPKWAKPATEEWRARAEALAAGDRWVMDGNYSGTLDVRMPRAQVVVLLDMSPWRCVWRVVKRRWLDRERPDIPEDCDDQLNWEFIHWIVSYRRRSLPRVLRRLDEHPHLDIVRLRRPAEVDAFVESLGSKSYIWR
ncbi:MAG: adenylate kinase [Gemmatimonadota bacterium]